MKNEKGSSIWQWFIKSLEAVQAGASARKLTALAIVLLVIIGRISWISYASKSNDFSLLEGLTIVDYSFIGLLLGLTTWQYLSDRKSIKNKDNEQN